MPPRLWHPRHRSLYWIPWPWDGPGYGYGLCGKIYPQERWSCLRCSERWRVSGRLDLGSDDDGRQPRRDKSGGYAGPQWISVFRPDLRDTSRLLSDQGKG